MSVVFIACAVMLVVAAGAALVRAERGPSMLDRTLALDVMTSALVGVVALEAAWTRSTANLPVLVALALVGFVGSVTISRFASVEPKGEGRVLTREEAAELDARERATQAMARRRATRAEERAVDDEHHGGGAEGEVR